MTSQRRQLKFASMDEIMPDVDRLLDGGYTQVGNWSLAQICNHISSAILWSMEGYPIKLPWIVRATMGNVIKNKILSSGKMKEKIPVPEKMMPPQNLDDRAEAEALRAAIRLYNENPTQRAPHAFFGSISNDELDQLHRIHAAHHLSFALPK